MTVHEAAPAAEPYRTPSKLEMWLNRLLYIDGETLAYVIIFILAVLTRFWDLGARVMSHDESLHTRYSWNLYKGNGFTHTPLMHGPLLFHMAALSYLLFGDNDFTARIYPALVGVALVMVPYFMRKWLGRTGALVTSVLFLISPLILYYSRYIRHDLPAILSAVIIAVAAWNYIEKRKIQNLLWIGGAQAVLFASKEVSFIYIAIFGSFLILYFIIRLLDVEWKSKFLYLVFGVSVIGVVVSMGTLGYLTLRPDQQGVELTAGETAEPADPQAQPAVIPESEAAGAGVVQTAAAILMGVSLTALVLSVLIGQWKNLRRFPELDVMIVMGSLILPMLTPFVMHFTQIAASKIAAGMAAPPGVVATLAAMNPMDETPAGIRLAALFTTPMFLIAAITGVIWGIEPPAPRLVPDLSAQGDDETDSPRMIEVKPDLIDWASAFITSRWWPVAALYWLIFLFFFTTMFTNGAGLGTGVIGSLAYWLEQQGVKRGNQPWYYYLLVMLPVYEFLPVILSMAAGVVGLGTLATRLVNRLMDWSRQQPTVIQAETDPQQGDEAETPAENAQARPKRPYLDLDAPINFPALLLVGYWVIINLIAYSIAGEKMPWLTTHLTTPMILLGGWVVGRAIDRVDWPRLWANSGWLLFLLVPMLVITLLRVTGPLCALTPNCLVCNTIIPLKYQAPIFAGQELANLQASYGWLAGLVGFVPIAIATVVFARRVRIGQAFRVVGLIAVGWLTFMTARAAWWAAYVNYDEATEYLVYAHSAGAVKEVLSQIEEISLKTTDGYGLRVAYDNRVSWPYSWYLRDYYNAIYYGEQPSRGLIGDAPVILAGPDNWNKVESLLGNRYYQFEYIRMWWPMQDYFNLENYANLGSQPDLQRGIWEIITRRDYTLYGQAVGRSFEISEWPVAERMRFYVRKDVFAQVWDYGVAASEITEALDPYAVNQRDLRPELVFGTGMLNEPHGIALGPDGLLYVADTKNHRVAVFDQNGTLIRTFGTFGLAPQPDVLNEPWDVSVSPDGSVYVADTWNHRIVKYSAEGEYLTNWGFEGPNQVTEPLAFWGPRGIAVDDQGNIYLADTGNKRVQVFDQDGFFVRQIGSGGPLEGQLDEPVGLALDGARNLYVADTWNQRIEVFTPDGLYVRQWPFEGWFAQTNERPYISIDQQGNVYVTDPEAFRVVVFTGSGQYLYSFGDFNVISLVGGIVADDGKLFIVDTGAGTIQRYNLYAEELSQ